MMAYLRYRSLALPFALLLLGPYLRAQAGVDVLTAMRETAQRQLETADYAGAERTIADALVRDPASADLLYLRGYLFFKEHRYDDSLASYTEAASHRGPSSDDLVVVASDYIVLKDYIDAERWLKSAVASAPQNASAWYLLGRTQYLEDHNDDALASFTQCLALRPRDLRALYNKGLAFERLGQVSQALTTYQTSIEWEKEAVANDPQPYLDLGMLLLAQGRGEEAVTSLQQATARGKSNPRCFQELGRALEATGHDAEAVQAYRTAIALAPNAQQPHFFLARLLRRLKQVQEADAQVEIISRLYGGSSGMETPNPESAPALPIR